MIHKNFKKKVHDMVESLQKLQDNFLHSVQENEIPLTIFLVNGVKLTGIVSAFDSSSVLLKRDEHVQLVYKHAISTIMPSQPVNLDAMKA